MQFLNFFKQVDSNGQILKEFDLNRYTNNSSKGCVLEVDLEYPKEQQELHNDYPLASTLLEARIKTKKMHCVLEFN